MTDQLDIASVQRTFFLPHVKSAFSLSPEQAGGDRVVLTLEEVTEYPDHRSEEEIRSGRRRPFGLIFRCGSHTLAQGTYQFSHPELPPLELFATPIAGGEGWSEIEAVIN